jgi:hypothetical protein
MELLVSAVPVWRSEHAAVERGLADGDGLRGDLRVLSACEG